MRYEDNNVAYPGSLVPDLINEQYECRHRGLLDDDESSSTAFGYGKDSGDNFVDDSDDDSASSYDDFDFCYEPETCVLDDPDDFGPEDQYWFHPKTTDDLLRALDAPKYLGGCRLYAHRCYNCRRWNEMVPTVNTKDDGCGIYYDRDIDRDLDNCSPDEDGEVCKRFKFRHKTHG